MRKTVEKYIYDPFDHPRLFNIGRKVLRLKLGKEYKHLSSCTPYMKLSDSFNETEGKEIIWKGKTIGKTAPLNSLKNTISGNVFIVATGPSLSKIDFNLYIDNFNISIILKESDLVIGSGGLSLLERLTVGVPSITFPISENQNLIKKKIHKLNCTYFITEELINDFIGIMMKLINNYKLRERMSKLARIKFDGKGVLRVSPGIYTDKEDINNLVEGLCMAVKRLS